MKTWLCICFFTICRTSSLVFPLLIGIHPLVASAQTSTNKETTRSILGVVDKIDLEGKTFTIKNSDGKSLRFNVDKQTVIKKFDSDVAFSDIKVGSSIGIRYLDKVGVNHFDALVLRTDGEIPAPPPFHYPPRNPPTNSPPDGQR